MTKVDKAALALALDHCRSENPARVAELEKNALGWERMAKWAAIDCQIRHLMLPPWQPPPALVIDADDQQHPEAAGLLRRMRRRGVSRWHPDPAAVIRGG